MRQRPSAILAAINACPESVRPEVRAWWEYQFAIEQRALSRGEPRFLPTLPAYLTARYGRAPRVGC